MNKQEFSELFLRSLEVSAENAEDKLGQKIPREFKILLYGAGFAGEIMSLEDALEFIYLDESTFYVIIDVSVIGYSRSTATVFTRVSAHTPGPFHSTRYGLEGSGPFNQLIAAEIKFEPE